MAPTSAIITSFLAVGALARVPSSPPVKAPSGVIRYQIPLDEMTTKLNTSAIVHTPPKHPKVPVQGDYVIVAQDCLDPLDRPISEDCEALCEYINKFQGPVKVGPYDIETFEHGHCAFGIANLEACDDLVIDPLNSLYGFCQSMYTQCALNGYDAFIEFKQPSFAIAMSGTAAAPPYEKEPCT